MRIRLTKAQYDRTLTAPYLAFGPGHRVWMFASPDRADCIGHEYPVVCTLSVRENITPVMPAAEFWAEHEWVDAGSYQALAAAYVADRAFAARYGTVVTGRTVSGAPNFQLQSYDRAVDEPSRTVHRTIDPGTKALEDFVERFGGGEFDCSPLIQTEKLRSPDGMPFRLMEIAVFMKLALAAFGDDATVEVVARPGGLKWTGRVTVATDDAEWFEGRRRAVMDTIGESLVAGGNVKLDFEHVFTTTSE